MSMETPFLSPGWCRNPNPTPRLRDVGFGTAFRTVFWPYGRNTERRRGEFRKGSDTVGEFPSRAVRPEHGQDGYHREAESWLSGDPDEFANSIGSESGRLSVPERLLNQ